MYDVVVVGGGPAGCHTAALLSQKGFNVHVLEEHATIGEPVDCSGVIGAEAFRELEAPCSIKFGEISKLTFVSPANLEVNFALGSPLAYIVDRGEFDRFIAERARSSGVTFHLGCRVSDLQVQKDCVEATVIRNSSTINGQSTGENVASRVLHVDRAGQSERTCGSRETKNGSRDLVRARMAILASGPRYKLQRRLGMGGVIDFLRTAQVEVPVNGVGSAQILLGSRVAPGSFAWIAPFRRGAREFARVGVSSKTSAGPFLKVLIARLRSAGHLNGFNPPARSWVIPISPLKRTFADRVLAVGDAAGQTKPTTGGGIYYGILGAKTAADVVGEAFRKGDFSARTLRNYDKEWRKLIGAEVRKGVFFRRLYEHLTDEEINDLFRVVQSDGILASLSKKARFDWHKDVINFILRHPELGKIFLRGLFR